VLLRGTHAAGRPDGWAAAPLEVEVDGAVAARWRDGVDAALWPGRTAAWLVVASATGYEVTLVSAAGAERVAGGDGTVVGARLDEDRLALVVERDGARTMIRIAPDGEAGPPQALDPAVEIVGRCGDRAIALEGASWGPRRLVVLEPPNVAQTRS
jgi:hypothetical protein